MSLLDEVRNTTPHAEVAFRQPNLVTISAEARDALVELADAAQAFVATTSYYRQRKESRPEFEEFALALERLQR